MRPPFHALSVLCPGCPRSPIQVRAGPGLHSRRACLPGSCHSGAWPRAGLPALEHLVGRTGQPPLVPWPRASHPTHAPSRLPVAVDGRVCCSQPGRPDGAAWTVLGVSGAHTSPGGDGACFTCPACQEVRMSHPGPQWAFLRWWVDPVPGGAALPPLWSPHPQCISGPYTVRAGLGR